MCGGLAAKTSMVLGFKYGTFGAKLPYFWSKNGRVLRCKCGAFAACGLLLWLVAYSVGGGTEMVFAETRIIGVK